MSAYSDLILSKTPRAYYRLGEASGTPDDSSGNLLHIDEVLGNPTYSITGAISGDSNTAMSFDGTGDALSTADNALLDLADVFTLEAWVKLNATGAAYGIVSKQASAYYLRIDSDGTLNLLRSQTTDIVHSTTAITDTVTWHHVVGTKDGATVKLYIDGVDKTGTVTNDACANNINNLIIGADDYGVTVNPANMKIDEVAIYATALSASSVLENYQAATGQILLPAADPPIGILGRGAGW